jgi:hypothetical protein
MVLQRECLEAGTGVVDRPPVRTVTESTQHTHCSKGSMMH